jgi:acyl-CoA reductase-like NAD-dependent aldehyde dehydrogenase
MEEELFGPILPVIEANYVQAYKAISRYVFCNVGLA